MCCRFSADRRGSIAVTAAIVFTVLISLVGIALDFGRAKSVKAHLQAVADSAALAAAEALSVSEADMKTAGNAYVDGNLDIAADTKVSAPNVVKDGNGSRVSLTAELPTTFARIMGVSELDVSVTARAEIGVMGREEIALVVDVSASMLNDQKLENMKAAATDLINRIRPFNAGSNYRVVSLIPFAESVNLGSSYNRWLGAGSAQYPNSNFAGCFRPESDASITSELIPTPGPGNFEAMLPLGSESKCPVNASRVRFAASDATELVNAINGLEAMSGTGVDLALSWAWRMLSPQWEGMFDGPYTFPKPYGGAGDKTIILLTDGRAWRDDPDGDGDKDPSDLRASVPLERFKKVCDAIEDQGNITIHTIGFELDAARQEMIEALEDCATKGGRYLPASKSSIRKVLSGLAKNGTSGPYLTD